MIRRALCALAPTLLLVTAGCGSTTSTPPHAHDRATGEVRGDYVSDGLPDPFGDGDALRVTFRDGNISFSATCNTMSGSAERQGGTLSVSRLAGTEMGCPGRGAQQDQWLVDFFTSGPDISVDGTDVRLAADGDEIWLVPTDEVAPEPGAAAPLPGTTWRLTGIESRDGDSAGVMVVDPYRATLRIHDGAVEFDTTCNDAGGKVEVVGDRLRLRRIMTTLMACPDARGEIEREVSRVLRPAWIDWSISGEELRLTRGHRTLIYRVL